jgi:hypothetical protein
MIRGMVVTLWLVARVEVKDAVVLPTLIEPVKMMDAVTAKVPLAFPVTTNVLPSFWNTDESKDQ